MPSSSMRALIAVPGIGKEFLQAGDSALQAGCLDIDPTEGSALVATQ